jgi:hypothetical protein
VALARGPASRITARSAAPPFACSSYPAISADLCPLCDLCDFFTASCSSCRRVVVSQAVGIVAACHEGRHKCDTLAAVQTVRIRAFVLDAIIAHAQRDAPNECCGLLVERRHNRARSPDAQQRILAHGALSTRRNTSR